MAKAADRKKAVVYLDELIDTYEAAAVSDAEAARKASAADNFASKQDLDNRIRSYQEVVARLRFVRGVVAPPPRSSRRDS